MYEMFEGTFKISFQVNFLLNTMEKDWKSIINYKLPIYEPNNI